MTGPQGGAQTLEAVIDAMRGKEAEVGDRLCTRLADRIPSYRAVPGELIEEAWSRHFRRALTVLRDGSVPAPEDIDEADVARDRLTRGVPLGDGLRAFRGALGAIRDLFISEATRRGLDPLLMVERTKALWQLADTESLQIASVHRRAEVDAALLDARRRADFLRGLLYGTHSAAEINSGAAIYGLDPQRRYQAIRAVPRGGLGLDRSERVLETLCRAHGRTAMLAVLDETIAGVTETRPVIGEPEFTAGLGPPTHLGEVHRSFLTAGRMLDAARAYDRTGVYDLGDLSWRAAVLGEPELSAVLVARYLTPLEAEGAFGELIEESVRLYLETGRHIADVARSLHIHVNTARYRLRRFEELTGARLDSPDTTVEISWALAARELRTSGSA
ncbi:hypothetical protein GR925_17975 [Streptomyces sp. HUCO-GS316]|uniref:PucR family transcriptional regulator n=1 Tax=Streptomyces sp. HUCO-GS316 TaxID=2692198 RepID=UPI00136BDE71|nr:PucR family transcriptional regulator [Streptomyces sp. HUCO-GS316]MXM65283.1 hypothetical protein [Streptomyces sp. HUCO-GS316]